MSQLLTLRNRAVTDLHARVVPADCALRRQLAERLLNQLTSEESVEHETDPYMHLIGIAIAAA